MTRPEQYGERQRVIDMLEAIAPSLERINRAAAETAYVYATRLKHINERIAKVIAREEASERTEGARRSANR